jgi:hypothetical protein
MECFFKSLCLVVFLMGFALVITGFIKIMDYQYFMKINRKTSDRFLQINHTIKAFCIRNNCEPVNFYNSAVAQTVIGISLIIISFIVFCRLA